MKRLLSFLLCIAIVLACVSGASAQGTETETGTLKVMNYNIDGLPIPAFMTSENRDPLACALKLPDTINAYDADLIAMQEDFNFHFIYKEYITLPNKTIHAGGIPFGDGLNLYSRYPLYNVVREPWEQAYGILDSSSDELTPKGFMCASMQIADGVYVDVYDLHADADDGEQDIAARVAQFQQLLAYVEDYSKDHAVLIIGDTNARFLQLPSRLKELFIDGAGFKEAWVEAENEGRYTVTPEDVERFTAEYPSWWGYWDSAEKIFYRDGGGVSLELASHEYVWHFDEEGNRLADHAAQIAEFTYTINRSAVQDSRRYKQERWRPIHMLRLYIKYFFKSLFLILSDLPRYLLEKIDRPS